MNCFALTQRLSLISLPSLEVLRREVLKPSRAPGGDRTVRRRVHDAFVLSECKASFSLGFECLTKGNAERIMERAHNPIRVTR